MTGFFSVLCSCARRNSYVYNMPTCHLDYLGTFSLILFKKMYCRMLNEAVFSSFKRTFH